MTGFWSEILCRIGLLELFFVGIIKELPIG
jgi:hypothetical protein